MTPGTESRRAFSLGVQPAGEDSLEMRLEGRLDAASTGPAWEQAREALQRRRPAELVVEASGVDYCDGAGMAFLLALRRWQEERGGRFEMSGLREDLGRVLSQFDPAELDIERYRRREQTGLLVRNGRAVEAVWGDLRRQVEFVGELVMVFARALLRPRSLRWKDVPPLCEKVGADGLPIVLLIGFLMGLIMAFQAAVILRQFGAEVFVANFIGLSLVRELGPLVTAVILAGRSGSAFAAEIGTMEVNDEVNALETMGLDPVRMLVTGRVLAAIVMMPLLTMFFNLAGIVGGACVLYPMGVPPVAYANQILSSVGMADLLGGLAKSLVLALLVGAIGCLRGLQTGRSASAVGDSTTRAVVSAIVLITVADGVFAVVYYYLGI